MSSSEKQTPLLYNNLKQYIYIYIYVQGKGSCKGKRQIDKAHAEVLLGDVYALSGRFQQAGESYEAAMAIFRVNLPPQHKHTCHLQDRMLALLHKQQHGVPLRD